VCACVCRGGGGQFGGCIVGGCNVCWLCPISAFKRALLYENVCCPHASRHQKRGRELRRSVHRSHRCTHLSLSFKYSKTEVLGGKTTPIEAELTDAVCFVSQRVQLTAPPPPHCPIIRDIVHDFPPIDFILMVIHHFNPLSLSFFLFHA
jgi:hypothetical protein